MKLHIVTIGKPRLAYAVAGWDEYWQRLKHFHTVRSTHIADKHNDASHIRQAIGSAHAVALVIDGPQLSSPELAAVLEQRALDGRELAFVIGGPEGLPDETIQEADTLLSFSKLTFPHDLAMVVLLEALYRASTINTGSKYHK